MPGTFDYLTMLIETAIICLLVGLLSYIVKIVVPLVPRFCVGK